MPKKSDKKSKPTNQDETKNRRIKNDRYKSFKLQTKIKPDASPLPNVWLLFKESLKTLTQNWKVFSGILLIYAVLSLVLVHGFIVGSGLSEAKQSLESTFSGATAELASSANLFLQMFNTSESSGNQAAGIYQFSLMIIVSLALIWCLRQIYAKNKVRIRDGFYRGMYPLVPFLLVLAVVALQLLPALIGALLYGQVTSNGIAVTNLEMFLWGSIFLIFAVISLYLISSSLFALYIVCLPDMTPLRALRSARNLVRNRRWTIMRKVIALPLVLIAAAAILIIPLIMFATPVAPWVFLLFSVVSLAITHSYMYRLYRSLL